MCGLAGVMTLQPTSQQALADIANALAEALRHRGPDDQGVWVDAENGLALAHRRLSVLDLSEAGHQPMVSQSGRYVIAYNGEIYNHLQLREEMEAQGEFSRAWRGHSDTETLLVGIEIWGLERTLQKAVGMFAFALWDREARELWLARDRMGEKPLYYGINRGVLLFASELKAMHACPSFNGVVDAQALSLLMQHSAVPSPFSIYSGIHKLVPGTVIKLTRAYVEHNRLPLPQAYWSLQAIASKGQSRCFQGMESEAEEALDQLLRQSIGGQMISDVPLGAFLSGGVDSSTVVAIMQAQSACPVRTFSIGFNETAYNEAEYAREVARHLGTQHTEMYVTPAQALDVIPQLPCIYDEPFADISQIPTYLVCELAKQQVSVSLSGDGGDELFGGYNRYLWAPSIWRKIRWMPRSCRAAMAGVMTSVAPVHWDSLFHALDRFLPGRWRQTNPGDKLHKLADILAVTSPDEIYAVLVSHWKAPSRVVQTIHGARPAAFPEALSNFDLAHRMMYLDAVSYLPDDILVKVDRAAMAVSLETRVPFLDHRIIEFAWSLPLSIKIHGGQSKWLLRRVLDRYVPKHLIERPKMGFGVPIDRWLRGPLRDWSEDLLSEARLKEEGYFDARQVREKWHGHLSGRHNWSHQLWGVLMFQAWQSSFRHKTGGPGC